MRFFTSREPSMPSPSQILPGRPQTDHEARPAHGPRHAHRRPVARGNEDRDLRSWLLLGRREGVLAAARRRDDGRRLRRRHHPEPDLRGVLLRQDGPCRGRPRGLRPLTISYEQLLKTFWEDHDPTQVMRQGNDIGTEYRSIILTTDDEQQRVAEASRDAYQANLSGPATADRHGDRARRARSTMPRTTTSSTSTRTPAATARSTRPA